MTPQAPPPRSDLTTHEVTNQPPARGDLDLWAGDPVLATHAAGAETAALSGYARALGSSAMRAVGRRAERHGPVLQQFDPAGRRLDEVEFDASYHTLMRLGLEAGYAAAPWTGGSHLAHAAMVYLHSQVEPGTCCPMTMTYAAVPALAAAPEIAARWVPKLTAARYDPRVLPVGQKDGATLGMAMTEKQGGSDVRANATRAVPDGQAYRLTGHKWFCSAPMSDGFLTLAQAPGGLSCFLVPRWLEEGRNAIRLMRLKDKLGNRANASAEIEYDGALAWRLGEEGAGVRTIIEMVHHTRLDTAMAPAGLMRAALDEMHHWVSHRAAFQKKLVDQPLMRAVLADMVLDWEGATALGLHVARLFDAEGEVPRAHARLAVALAKFLSNKLAPRVIAEAMEGLGGIGYVEEAPLAMLYREAPLNGIWEGSGNVICLDILRSWDKVDLARDALTGDLDAARGADRRYDAALDAHRARWRGAVAEGQARAFAEELARLLTAAVLIRTAPGAVADGYCATRLGAGGSTVYGGVTGLDTDALLARLGAV